LDGIIRHVPQPKIDLNPAFSMLVTQTQPNQFYGKMLLGKVNSGELIIGKELKVYDQDQNFV
jgi:GTP-binding protein